MRTWMIWQGGVNYAPSDLADTEEFASLSAAVEEFRRRASGSDPYYPCVEGSFGHIFLSDPRAGDPYRDAYPDRVVEVGPRGGVKVSAA